MKKNMIVILCALLMGMTACGSDSAGHLTEESVDAITQEELDEDEVKLLQEAYMNTLHSVKGETIVTRSEGEGVFYTEVVKTEEEGHVDVYHYSFADTQKQYERMLKNYAEEDSCTIVEQDDRAFYIKVKDNDGMSAYFDIEEDAAIRGSEFETYIE